VTIAGGHDDERTMLTGFLDWYRGVAAHKLAGLSLDDGTRVQTPTGMTMLGVVNHLAWCEQVWFEHHFRGEDRDARDNTSSFRLEPADTVESVTARYGRACDAARHVVAEEPSLDALSTVAHPVWGTVSLRWILVHMIDETARHAGHLDVLREWTDGRTGD
jgi:uncharacterized damage-inducible protein DinB